MYGVERLRWQVYNWYDSRRRAPLEQKNTSSIVSGNLAGHLIALAHACEEMAAHPRLHNSALAGIDDTAQLVRLASIEAGGSASPRAVVRGHLEKVLDDLTAATQALPQDSAEWISQLTVLKARAQAVLDAARARVDDDSRHAQTDVVVWAEALCATVDSHLRDVDIPETLTRRLTSLAQSARALVEDMDFGFLFDPMRKLLAIGYRVTDGSLDDGRYDLLASEARLASFVAIAKGDVPVAHWFRLDRKSTRLNSSHVEISYSGSMFEYLMPGLVMRAPAGSLLE